MRISATPNTGEVVELFDGGGIPLDESSPQVRVIVARHAAPPPGKKVTVGKRVGEWVYELFMTTLPINGVITFFRTLFPAKDCQGEKKPESFPLS
jgi:hypothetical protein